MIIEVKKTLYKGIRMVRVDTEKQSGWKCNLGGQEYIFPTYVNAKASVDEIFRDIKPIITKNKGQRYKKAECTETSVLDSSLSREELMSKLREALLANKNDERREEIFSIMDAIIAIDQANI
jgi:hypothetical protein